MRDDSVEFSSVLRLPEAGKYVSVPFIYILVLP